MSTAAPSLHEFAPDTFRFYRHALQLMKAAEIPFLVGGAYAFASYTGITRHTKDLDLFIHPADTRGTLAAFGHAGYKAELIFEHWLAKAFHDGDFVDIIFNSGNGACHVDDTWFEQAVPGIIFGERVRLVPVEEMIWQKAYIMERERFDGADVIHLVRACGRALDWDRLLKRFGDHWRVLLSHLVLFGFVYPADADSVPGWVLRGLLGRLERPGQTPADINMCRGTLLSRLQYLTDTETWHYGDPRLGPEGGMTAEQVERWTDAAR